MIWVTAIRIKLIFAYAYAYDNAYIC
jgi:hypothetical protein